MSSINQHTFLRDKHTIFYEAYHYLRECGCGTYFNYDVPDDLDSLIWTALGHTNAFQVQYT